MLSERLRKIREFPWLETAKQIIIETPAEVYIGAVLGLCVATAVSYQHEDAKKGQIPLGFSEISQTKLMLQLANQGDLPSLTRAYSMANDVPMQVFEASNLAYTWDRSFKKFAYELEKKNDPSMRVHTLISDYAKQAGEVSRKALDVLSPWTSANDDLPAIIKTLDAAWEDSHRDVEKTEYYYEEECSGSGNDRKCQNVRKSRQVYDYTIHSYEYNKKQGERAARLLKDFMAKHPDLRINEQLLLVPKTNAENEWAMRQSRKNMPGYKGLKQEDYLRYANMWATGSNYNVRASHIYNQHAALGVSASEWNTAKRTARDEKYRTYSRSDAGPEEFQIAEAAMAQASEMASNISATTNGISFAGAQIPVLSRKIKEFTDASLHGKEGNPQKLQKEVLDLARKIYQKNFPEGFDTYPAKWGMVFVWAVIGLLGGGLAGYGVDRGIARTRMSEDYFAQRYRRHSRFTDFNKS